MHTQSVVKLIANFSSRTNMVCLLAVSSVLHEWPNPPRTPLNFLTNYGFQFVQPQQGNLQAVCDIKGHTSCRKHNSLWGHGATQDLVARENSDINYASLNVRRWTYGRFCLVRKFRFTVFLRFSYFTLIGLSEECLPPASEGWGKVIVSVCLSVTPGGGYLSQVQMGGGTPARSR